MRLVPRGATPSRRASPLSLEQAMVRASCRARATWPRRATYRAVPLTSTLSSATVGTSPRRLLRPRTHHYRRRIRLHHLLRRRRPPHRHRPPPLCRSPRAARRAPRPMAPHWRTRHTRLRGTTGAVQGPATPGTANAATAPGRAPRLGITEGRAARARCRRSPSSLRTEPSARRSCAWTPAARRLARP